MYTRGLGIVFLIAGSLVGQPPAATPGAGGGGERNHDTDVILKAMTNAKAFAQLGDIAEISEVRYTSAPLSKPRQPNAAGAKNPLIIRALAFVPKQIDKSKKHPFVVFAHQGIHSDFGRDYEFNVVRELVQQGYSVIGPDYRGSTGYGAGFYQAIDYGGLEVEDVFQAKQWMLDNFDFLDPKRAGIIGWSHGGMITLMNLFQHPNDFAVGYAGVPVSDLVLRLGYHDARYQAIFSDPRHIGKTVAEDTQEYLRRSPITHVSKLEAPLLIHGNTNDEDVQVIEIERLVDALKAAGKKFEYKIYKDAPGGHEFGRIDSKLARESRREIYKFLAQYLKPSRPI